MIYTLPMADLVERLTELVKQFEEVSLEYANTKASKEAIEDQEKPFKAVLMEEHEGSQALKENKALADPRYRGFLDNMSKARLDFYLAQSRYEAVKTKIECLRTIISTRKEELNKFQG